MSGYELQKYYLINLSTRNISVSTHLRSENFTLKSGKCIYLGNLTDELVVKYHRYAALNLSLRILTKDKTKQILSKCINSSEELVKSLTEDVPLREAHSAGSIEAEIYVKQNDLIVTNANNQTNNNSFSHPNQITIPSTNASISLKQKENVNDNQINYSLNNESVIIDQEQLESYVKEDTVQKNLLSDGTPTEINVIEESIKQDVKDMSYNQLYDLAKARGLIMRGRPSRSKIIALLSEDVNNGGQL